MNGKMFRPEWIKISKQKIPSEGAFKGTVVSAEFLGAVTRYKIRLENQQVITADEPTVSSEEIKTGDLVAVSILKETLLR